MAQILLFHHAHGLTSGVLGFADELRTNGHPVTTPDLFDGKTFSDLDEGVAYAESVGFETLMDRGVAMADDLRRSIVYAGFSLGVMPAQKLAQTRDGALGALLYHETLPTAMFGRGWPDRVALQVHVSEDDPWADHEAIEDVHRQVAGSELYRYPGGAHLFADAMTPEYERSAADALMDRTLAFLARIDERHT